MAGKTKRAGSRSSTPKTPTPRGDLPGKGQLGHMGLKSSPYAPTDCKLVNQYMVLDNMQAHYKKLSTSKAAVDTSAPKSWLVSQKMRDQARREALSNTPRKAMYTPRMTSARRASLASNEDRVEMMAMMASISHLEDGDLDELDGHRPVRANTSVDIHRTDSSTFNHVGRTDMKFVNRMVNDTEMSPSKYHTGKTYQSNIPQNNKKRSSSTRVVAQKALYKTQVLDTYQSSAPLGYSRTKQYTSPSSDVIDQNAHKFTEEKPFQPRTLKSNRKSILSDFKYYTPPRRKTDDADDDVTDDEIMNGHAARPDTGMSTRAPSMRTSLRSRPGTANTMNSTDWMNETIISRDHTERDTPQGVPALDISLDQDHMKWIKDHQQTHKRLSAKAPHPDLESTRGSQFQDTHGMNGTIGRSSQLGTITLSDSGYNEQPTSRKLHAEEEELKYLQFIQDVTNDVLDRGIYTNRVLKVVFESHVARRKHELKVSKMRDMLEDLRIDLGIPATAEEDDPEGLGLTSTWSPLSSTLNARASRRSKQDSRQFSSTGKANLPTLHHSVPPRKQRTPSPEGKPPIPRPNSRGARSPNRSSSDKALTRGDDSSVFGTVTDVQMTADFTQSADVRPKRADVLTINHDDTENDAGTLATDGVDSVIDKTLRGDILNSLSDEEQEQAALYEKHLAHTLDDEDRTSLTGSEISRRSHSDRETERKDHSDIETDRRDHSDQETDRSDHSDQETDRRDRSDIETDRREYILHPGRETDRGDYVSDHSDFDEILDTKNLTLTKTKDRIVDHTALVEGDAARIDNNQYSDQPRKPTPRKRHGSDTKDTTRSTTDTARSQERGNTTTDTARSQEKGNTTTDTIEVSELDDYEDDYDTF